VVVLVIRGNMEQALAAANRRLGADLAVWEASSNGRETIIHVEEPLGHSIHRWLNEGSDLIWFNIGKEE
jgi:hypothetical protein